MTLPVPSRDEIGMLTESFNQMARSLREKEMIKRAFTRYVAREVVEEILKDPERLGPDGRAARGHRALLRHPRVHAAVGAVEPGRGCGAAQRLLHPHDRDHLQARRDARQVHGRRGDGHLRGAHRPPGSLGAGRPHRARHARGDRGLNEKRARAGDGGRRHRHRRERGRGGGGDRGHGGHAWSTP